MVEVISKINDFFSNTFNIIIKIIDFIKEFTFGMFDYLPNELKITMLVVLPILIAIFIYRFIR